MTKQRLLETKEKLTLGRLALIALLGTVLLAATSYAMNSLLDVPQGLYGPSNVINLTSKNQDLWGYIESNEKVVLFWETEFCPGCKILRPYLLDLAQQMPDVLFVRVHIDKLLSEDADYALALADEFKVYGTPTIIVYVNGVETGRHLGLFREAYVSTRSQGYYLEKFIRDSLENKPGGQTEASLQKLMGTGILAPMVFGVIGALAPCSLPMIASFAVVGGQGAQRRVWERIAVNTVTLVSATMTIGFVLALAYLVSTVMGVQVLYAGLLAYMGILILAWGLASVLGTSPVIVASPKHKIIFPLLGLQCSLPFLLVAIGAAPKDPSGVVAASAFFALGYSAPYIIAGVASPSTIGTMQRIASTRWFGTLQGLVLLVAGAYLVYESGLWTLG